MLARVVGQDLAQQQFTAGLVVGCAHRDAQPRIIAGPKKPGFCEAGSGDESGRRCVVRGEAGLLFAGRLLGEEPGEDVGHFLGGNLFAEVPRHE